jgi:uncharacterized protein
MTTVPRSVLHSPSRPPASPPFPVPSRAAARRSPRLVLAAVAAVAALAAFTSALAPTPALAQAAEKAQSLATIPLTIGGRKVVAEVARTPVELSTGLMWRFSLRPDHGMIFVYDEPRQMSFWMKNTYIPLSIAFIDAAGRIINIEDMAPQSEQLHWSRAPGVYALEMRKGWFAEHGIGVGAVVEGLPKSRQ